MKLWREEGLEYSFKMVKWNLSICKETKKLSNKLGFCLPLQPKHILLNILYGALSMISFYKRHVLLVIYLFILIFIFTLFYFTILHWFCHILTWIHHGCTWIPKYGPRSHLPPHIISLDHPCAPAPSILYPASNIDWRFVSYMIVYMLECQSMFDAGYSMLWAGARGWSRGMMWGGRWEGGIHVWELMYTHGRFMSMYAKINTVL